MELPKKFDAHFMVRTFFPEFMEDPSLINRGHCYDYAYVGWSLYPEAELWSNEHHAFIQIDHIFYDSEVVRGRRAWHNLQFFKRSPWASTPSPTLMTLDQFKSNWNTRGRYWRDSTMWESMLERITKAGFKPART